MATNMQVARRAGMADAKRGDKRDLQSWTTAQEKRAYREGYNEGLTPVADEDLEDDVWSAIMEAQGPDSTARDYAKAAIAVMIERGLVRS